MSSTFTPLAIMRLPGPGKLWQLQAPLSFGPYTVPAGMIADGNSGPLKNAESEPAGWLHDWLYRLDCPVRLTRREADAVFYGALRASGIGAAHAHVQWLAVRLLGGSSWRRKRVFGA